MKKQLPAWTVLLLITLAAGLALGGTYTLTKDAIAAQAAQAAENARRSALPEADSFEPLTLSEGAAVDWCYAGMQGGAVIGYVCQATVQGFGGPLEVIAGVNLEQKITGVSVGGSAFAETAGLGAKAKEPAFANQFADKQAPLTVVKTGETANGQTVDAITSATITSRAATGAVNQIAAFVGALTGPADAETQSGEAAEAAPAQAEETPSPAPTETPAPAQAAESGEGRL